MNRFKLTRIQPQNDVTARAGSVVSSTVFAWRMDKDVCRESVGVSTALMTIGRSLSKLERSNYSSWRGLNEKAVIARRTTAWKTIASATGLDKNVTQHCATAQIVTIMRMRPLYLIPAQPRKLVRLRSAASKTRVNQSRFNHQSQTSRSDLA